MPRRVLSILAYVLPTFPLGYAWHLMIFADAYHELHVFRQDVLIPFGVTSMLIQGIVWSIVYERLFAGERVLQGALKFACLALPLAWSYMVLAVAAKHVMSSVSGYIALETGFVVVHYAIVSPLIAWVYRNQSI